jgi:ABC-type antimicrobial peptide transport system permease subunit
MEDVRATALARDRFMTVLLLSFAGVGVLLGIVGIYGVVSQLARRRTREMGIRIALGSDTRQVQWLVLRRGLMLTGLGIIGGVSLAMGLTGAIRTLLYQVTPLDPLTFGLVPVLVLLTALIASWLPARRASRADPCECLRAE